MIWSGLKRRDGTATVLVVAVLVLLSFTPLFARLDALSADVLLLLRHQIFGQRHPASDSPTVVIAIDEQTYRTPPFADTPKVLWTPQIATVVDTALAAGAKVVGYDVVFPTSVESYLPGFERPFLLSLRDGARSGRLVLGKVQHQVKPVAPFAAQSLVVGNERNIRLLNVITDVDDVVRHVPLFFSASGEGRAREPSMALELAARALGVAPQAADDGAILLDGYSIPGAADNAVRVNFQGDNDIPTYSLGDLYACIQAGQGAAYFEGHFKGKVILVGEVLDLEDRKITGKRLMTGHEGGARADACRLAPEPNGADDVRRDTLPGVYIHAAAVNDLIRRDALIDFGRLFNTALIALGSLIAVMVMLRLKPAAGAMAVTAVAVAWTAITIGAAQASVVLPLLTTLFAMAISYGLMLGYRFMIADQQKARIRRLFSFYLAPAVVNRMVESEHLPELGGEMRRVTVWFSDVAGFTSFSEGLSPQELVAVMNEYFAVVTDIIEAHGGFVDKYIGDAIVAVFGAPLDDPAHAEHAVEAALVARARLAQLNAQKYFNGREVHARTGINTGDALVGNVGSSRRFNYTVMGDTVNTASRLEGANKATGTTLLIAEETAAALGPRFASRLIGRIRVKGRNQPVEVFEPLAVEGDQGFAQAQRVAAMFREANDLLLARRFAEAAACVADLSDDEAAEKLRERAAQLQAEPPGMDWDGVNTLSEK